MSLSYIKSLDVQCLGHFLQHKSYYFSTYSIRSTHLRSLVSLFLERDRLQYIAMLAAPLPA